MSGPITSARRAARARMYTGLSWAHAKVRGDEFSRLMLTTGMRDPCPHYRRLREAGPLALSSSGVWAITGHRLCGQVLRDSRFGVRTVPYQRDAQGPLEYQQGAEEDFSVLGLDPPDHGRVRKLAAPAFRPKTMASYRPAIERVTYELLDRAADLGSFDLMAELAAPLPIRVIAELLGVPDEYSGPFRDYGAIVAKSIDGSPSAMNVPELGAATRALEELFAELLTRRAREPGNDILSQIAADHAADRISPREVLALCRILLIAGFETTVNLVGNGMLALLNDPEQWAALNARPELATAVTEETLRYDPPVQATIRYPRETVHLAGRRIGAAEPMYVLTGAAGRDATVFADPDRFDIRRPARADHLAFGAGPHYCLGAPLARLEGEVFFAAVPARLPRLVRDGPAVRRPMMALRGLARLPVRAG
ncbi:hypothetical protein EV191_11247 [Tamaricihabitans halophyticus]|uniref:Cytochrome P450 n=1 Tax=Tamaricihabitans halophyticus TaxID=1262583 RepID=A0A4R2QDV8_9PSEU|nr:cytochrome P450 [Tamaricihabitans halophyticus]TCP47253.1 hypothetical protein EV191_11247 [Tamaricihabitans halophyticus]